ncbi:ATP-dependent helicase [Deinococcus yavapaiensis]|uniref:DNA 3'-5' helicase n=1 Tax=Deinococcus yavapaiensis KR-236 TaxID=694435 RepID=A0A318S8S2_9DEIO|nr:ATP-dependent helicase [Deinococcus yavapaiensis]PYE52042.1 DNA helicase-2/ATP-dependent DNA helicase PcrA [Deinococcus yavapaiensis KR-236]
MTRSAIPLTSEQQRIVAHDHGPALVFAVAGAGKTTAMVHRIERLVREGTFRPKEILATTFSRAAAADIRAALARWPHCSDVHATTLHSVGYRVIRRAQRLGHYDNLQLNDQDGGNLGAVIFARAVARARKEGLDIPDSLDREDFLGYVSICKGNLRYADLARAALPPEALRVATQAQNPSPDSVYLALYQAFETVRLEHGMVTFDDMLLTGWEALVRFPDVLRETQGQYRCVIVDEFQDVNLAQSEMLDLIAREHRNYMAIGDDDQTIYEWRGASVDFILNFAHRYGAVKYYIRDNFRSCASHLALANRVIERNTKREPKRLNLTRGFHGRTFLHQHDNAEDLARCVVTEIQDALAGGRARRDVAVLVRMYAQTPFIEHFLIEARVPYVVKGNVPFYQRSELLALFAYLRLALLERDLRVGKGVPERSLRDARAWWDLVYNRPVRYMPKVLADAVFQRVVQHGMTFSKALRIAAGEVDRRLGDRVEDLADVLTWLADDAHDATAEATLDALVHRLAYEAYLLRHGGLPETAQGRVNNVRALVLYARAKGTSAEFLQHLDYISFQKVGKNLNDDEDVVTITTIFRSKGLQWPIVFIPNCNAGTIPTGGPDRVEEERRILYVALTRPQETLHVHVVTTMPTSPFLLEAEHEQVLADVDRVQAALSKAPEAWSTHDAYALARLPRRLHLDRYFRTWWPQHTPPEQVHAVAQEAQRLYDVARQRDLLAALDLHEEDAQQWEMLGPLDENPSDDAYPDLAALVPTANGDVTKPTFSSSHASTAYLTTFTPQQRVQHAKFGAGIVEAVCSDGADLEVTVRFDGVGVKRLMARFARLTLANTAASNAPFLQDRHA